MRRLAVAFTVVVLAGCGASPTTPGPGAPSAPASLGFEGVWQFDYRVETCHGLRHCFAYLNTTRTITLRAIRGTSGFDGVVTVFSDNVDVGGRIAGGTLSLRGVRRPAIANDYEVEVTQLDLRHERSEVMGTFEYTVKGPSNSVFFGSSRVGGPVTAARLLAPVGPAGFAGTWKGRVAVRDCSSVGWQNCYPLEPHELWNFELSVAESGGRVTGLFQRPARADVEGTISGATMQLQGTGEGAGSSHTSVVTVRPSTFTRDAVGRLRGTMSLDMRWLWTDGRVSTSDFRVIELVGVVLMPPS
ncbi:MAG TPA: hypothetical protein VMN81_02305 [Vicinamibacterales bacterium]|nr:hypothetical protein [Vicinamibacterales bacterium]